MKSAHEERPNRQTRFFHKAYFLHLKADQLPGNDALVFSQLLLYFSTWTGKCSTNGNKYFRLAATFLLLLPQDPLGNAYVMPKAF
jgi:hypothetical protein